VIGSLGHRLRCDGGGGCVVEARAGGRRSVRRRLILLLGPFAWAVSVRPPPRLGLRTQPREFGRMSS